MSLKDHNRNHANLSYDMTPIPTLDIQNQILGHAPYSYSTIGNKIRFLFFCLILFTILIDHSSSQTVPLDDKDKMIKSLIEIIQKSDSSNILRSKEKWK